MVKDVPELIAALKACSAACAITLAPGDWRGVKIDHVDTHATITGTGAVIHDLDVWKSSGITFRGLEFSAVGAPVDPRDAGATVVFRINESSDINLDGVKVHGDPGGRLSETPSGFIVRLAHNITVTNSDFTHLHNALAVHGSSNVTIDQNVFHHLFDDAIRGGDDSAITISSNHCFSNHPDLTDRDHPDCIQLWTAGSHQSAHDIVIVNNRYERGDGNATQFIFLGNELHLPYQHVKISGNVGFGSMWNGIAISEADDVEISDNILVASCIFQEGRMFESWIVTGKVNNLRVLHNASGKLVSRGGDTNVLSSGNRVTECRTTPPKP